MNEKFEGIVEIASVLLVVFVIGSMVANIGGAIEIGIAVHQFEKITGTDNVIVMDHSDNRIIVGDRHDVTFNLLVDGEPKSGRCISGYNIRMVCHLYTGDE